MNFERAMLFLCCFLDINSSPEYNHFNNKKGKDQGEDR